jgi:glycosyltransferase involved in cell wall biosynthesis
VTIPALSVVYLLEDTVLFGGVKVILRQADLLADRGHQVTIVSLGQRPDWTEVRADFRTVPAFTPETVPAADVTVATHWTTINPALHCAQGEIVHYCQGYEASYTHNTGDHPLIDEVYRASLPAMTVSPHLGELLRERYGRPSRTVLQPLEPFWRPGFPQRLRRTPASTPRILVMGPWEGDWKGVRTGLEAVNDLRTRGTACTLVRLSQYPLHADEAALLAADEYHHHIRPEEAASLVRSCDLLLAPSWEQEGFGLPVLEAMAAGVPVVASDISAFRAFAAPAAVLVPRLMSQRSPVPPNRCSATPPSGAPHAARAWTLPSDTRRIGPRFPPNRRCTGWRRARGARPSPGFSQGFEARTSRCCIQWCSQLKRRGMYSQYVEHL